MRAKLQVIDCKLEANIKNISSIGDFLFSNLRFFQELQCQLKKSRAPRAPKLKIRKIEELQELQNRKFENSKSAKSAKMKNITEKNSEK